MIRIPLSIFDFIKDDKGGFTIKVNNDRAAIFNYGINRIADRLLEVAKSWTFDGIDDYWGFTTQYDKKSHLIKSIVFKNNAPDVQHTGGLSTEELWTLMEEGREGWRQGVHKYTFDTYPDSAEAKERRAKRKSERRGVTTFTIFKSRFKGSSLRVKRARLGDIYPTRPDFWLERAMDASMATFARQLEESDFGEVEEDYVSFGDMPGVDVIPNLYDIASGRGDLDSPTEDSEDFKYGSYGGEHRQDVPYGGKDPTPPWYASYY